MNRYRINISLDFEAADDPAARELLRPLSEIADDQGAFRDNYYVGAEEVTVKLQRLNSNAPPRLLDRWPRGEIVGTLHHPQTEVTDVRGECKPGRNQFDTPLPLEG